jgi:hypothetical protein
MLDHAGQYAAQAMQPLAELLDTKRPYVRGCHGKKKHVAYCTVIINGKRERVKLSLKLRENDTSVFVSIRRLSVTEV